MGGKTGTAQFSRNQAELGRAAYGWFVGFAPYDKPQIAVVGVVYDGGHGMYVARTVKDVFDQYFGIGNPLEELNKRLQENQDKLNQQKNVTATP
jgi:penicillin-binding protein 2